MAPTKEKKHENQLPSRDRGYAYPLPSGRTLVLASPFRNKFLQIINWSPETVRANGKPKPRKGIGHRLSDFVVLVYILAHFVQYTKANSAGAECKQLFGCGWVSFVTTNAATVLFEQRPLGLYLIKHGFISS